jgi:DNA-binding CsgD family transcriptional regulator
MNENSGLSEREIEILKLVATGVSNKEIARELFISPNTVKVHLKNIFSKIGVISRTEAAMYAVQRGWVTATNVESLTISEGEENQSIGNGVERFFTQRWRGIPYWEIGSIIFILILGITSGITLYVSRSFQQKIIEIAPTPTSLPRWQKKADLPTARYGLAAAVYENQIYAIGGETENGVTGVVEKYNPRDDAWLELNSKPTPVTDVGAVVIGGKIFIPGGRTNNSFITNILEIYDPKNDSWELGSPLPIPLSAYAITAFEGKMYLFGGLDGEKVSNRVFEYNPDQDIWRERAPMPTVRDYAGAAVAGGKIFVIGGYDGKEPLAGNEEYLPERDSWTQRAPLPAGRYALGVTSIADIIYIVGGEGEKDSPLPPLQYVHQQDQWQEFEEPFPQHLSHLGVVPIETQLYGVGGWWNGIPAAQNMAYQAIYTILIPIIP